MSPGKNSIPQAQASRWNDRLAELDMGPRLVAHESASHQETLAALRERVKELNCIFAFSQLMDREQYSVEDFMSRVVDVLPPSWQFPEVACARIDMGTQTFKSLFYRESPWQLTSNIQFPAGITGQVSIIYSEPRPPSDEGPFLKEERHLLDAVAIRLGRVADRKRTDAKLAESYHQLAIERTALREANTALRLILNRIEEEKNEVQLNILDNVNKILLPIIRELSISVTPEQKDYVNLLAENLEHITSPFIRTLSTENETLTTTEVQICELVRSGMGSKEIANLRKISIATVNRHREHIRNKLGIANRKINLATYLRNTM